MAKEPNPFRPLATIQRDTLPDQKRERVPLPTTRPVRPKPPLMQSTRQIDEQPARREHPQLIIRADITIPQTPGFAKRLSNLLKLLRAEIEAQAPWLSDIEIEVEQ